MHSSMTRNQPEFKNVNMSPPNDRIQKKLGRRIRSRSRSYNEPRFGSRIRYSSKNRQRSQSRSGRKSKSLDRRDNVTERQSSSKPKHDRSFKSSKNYKKEIGKGHPPPNKKKWKKIKSTQPTQQPPTPVVDSGPTVIPPPVAPQVQGSFYSQNATPMYYAQPTHMQPRLMPVPYYMRSRLPYPPTYPRLLYRPQRQPPVRNFIMVHNEEA
ncbi:unnamed protein product [Macrosiphum euphorbiae]|uniref:Female-specific protein transformer n=1 Tax=Macrosiphum euphorbiae TaxID=13131 RepID=A0AAV0Y643_9HEMI|nr:unnamed protein product [Macrosiphum euphorbiae]